MVERAAVNRVVVGSSPTRGAKAPQAAPKKSRKQDHLCEMVFVLYGVFLFPSKSKCNQ